MKQREALKNIVITGGTRGIGFAMAREFLKQGNNVTISGTKDETIKTALEKLAEFDDRLQAIRCDVTNPLQVKALWDKAVERWKKVEIWVNNAGISQPYTPVWEVSEERIRALVETNVIGTIYGSRVAMTGMIGQGHGAIYNMEGWGSDGNHMDNLNLYGMTKRAVQYFSIGLAQEAKPHKIIVGVLQPGMMVTDFILEPLRANKERLARMKKVINLVADTAENVAPVLVREMLRNKKPGKRISYLTGGRMFARMLSSIFTKRDILKDAL
jgi:NAD(P)-dependent dehydrogenase (short-subunit alcohol dehydrogenase family)